MFIEGHRSITNVEIDKDTLSFLCLYRSKCLLKKEGTSLILSVSAPEDINDAMSVEDLSTIPYCKADEISLPAPLAHELSTALVHAGLLGDGFWKDILSDRHEWRHENTQVRFFSSTLATQEACWLYVNDSHLHLDRVGCTVLGFFIRHLCAS